MSADFSVFIIPTWQVFLVHGRGVEHQFGGPVSLS